MVFGRNVFVDIDFALGQLSHAVFESAEEYECMHYAAIRSTE